jgi:zinc finger CCHC domain-containing protein 9
MANHKKRISGKSEGIGKPKMTKDERRAKYTQIARDRKAKQVAREKSIKLVCYNCRKLGHAVSECPEQKSQQKMQQSDVKICYKCGSHDHALAACPSMRAGGKKHDGTLPFATCFICHLTGHLASKCSQNEKGIYVNGGACKTCGSKQHRATDCPEKQAPRKEPINAIPDENIEDLLEAEDKRPSNSIDKLVQMDSSVYSPATIKGKISQKKKRVVTF